MRWRGGRGSRRATNHAPNRRGQCLTLEYLVPTHPSGEAFVFGVHLYVLGSNGENAFSFLLNSHHQLLLDANLRSADASNAGREALALKGTPVALEALLQQIQQARLEMSK